MADRQRSRRRDRVAGKAALAVLEAVGKEVAPTKEAVSGRVVSRPPALRPPVVARESGRAATGLVRRTSVDMAVPTPAAGRRDGGHGGTGDLQSWQGPRRKTGTVWFDHTDLAHYFYHNRTPTGIQRVEIELYRAGRRRITAAGGPRAAACAFDPDRRCWVRLPPDRFDVLCGLPPEGATEVTEDGLSAELLDDEGWQLAVLALHKAITEAPPAPFRRGDVLVTVGASWWIPDYLTHVRHLRHESGVLYAPFVHDCIPLLVAETCAADLVGEFRDWFTAVLQSADLMFANSRCTARDILICAETGNLPMPTPHVVRLDAHAGMRPPEAAAQGELALTQARLAVRGRYALFVATVEARKDHIFVFRCWQQLIAQYGPDVVPDLLCVGKNGWLVEFTLNWLRVNPSVAGKIRLLGTVSDGDLAALYGGAEFCVYNSKYEGWGLPVTESLCHGRVPVVPDHSSLPEAGGPFAVYFEPGSADSFSAQVMKLLDGGFRAGLERRIRNRFRPRSWAAVLEQIVATAANAPVRPRPAAAGIPVEPGVIYSFARRRSADPVMQSVGGHVLMSGALVRFGPGWWAMESWGCWSRQPVAHLLFSLPRADPRGQKRRHLLYLVLRGGPAPQLVRIQAAHQRLGPILLQPHQRHPVRLALDDVVSAAGDVLITLSAEIYALADHTDGQDKRIIGFGLEALAVIADADVQARTDLLELAMMPG